MAVCVCTVLGQVCSHLKGTVYFLIEKWLKINNKINIGDDVDDDSDDDDDDDDVQ